MTSHNFEVQSTDELDGLIRWALRHEAANARLSPYVWGRIYTQVERQERLGSGFGSVLRQVFEVSAFLFTRFIKMMQTQDSWAEWRVDPRFSRFLADQYGFFLLQLAF